MQIQASHHRHMLWTRTALLFLLVIYCTLFFIQHQTTSKLTAEEEVEQFALQGEPKTLPT